MYLKRHPDGENKASIVQAMVFHLLCGQHLIPKAPGVCGIPDRKGFFLSRPYQTSSVCTFYFSFCQQACGLCQGCKDSSWAGKPAEGPVVFSGTCLHILNRAPTPLDQVPLQFQVQFVEAAAKCALPGELTAKAFPDFSICSFQLNLPVQSSTTMLQAFGRLLFWIRTRGKCSSNVCDFLFTISYDAVFVQLQFKLL